MERQALKRSLLSTPEEEEAQHAKQRLKEELSCYAVEVSFAVDDEEKFVNHFEDFIGAAVKNRTAEVVVKHLSAEDLKKVREAKQKEIDQWMKYKVVEAASKQGIPNSMLMRMRWVITRKGEGFKGRLVLLGYQAANLGQVKTASPTCSRRARQIFFSMAASVGMQVSKGNVKNGFFRDKTTRTSCTRNQSKSCDGPCD